MRILRLGARRTGRKPKKETRMSGYCSDANYPAVRASVSTSINRAPWVGVVAGMCICNVTATAPTHLLNALGWIIATYAFFRRDRAGIDQCAAFYRRHKGDATIRAVWWAMFGKFVAGMYFVSVIASASASPELGLEWSFVPMCIGAAVLGWRMERRASDFFVRNAI